MKRHLQGLVLLAGTASLFAINASAEELDQEIELTDVPEHVMTAALAAVDGIVLTEAEIEDEDGQKVYELEGVANGVEYEIDVLPDGTVVEVEAEDEDDDDS